MWNEPTKQQLSKLPRLYANEKKESLNDVIIHMHFFMGGCDWYAAEFDGDDIFWGFVNLNDPLNAEWGYFSLKEMPGNQYTRHGS